MNKLSLTIAAILSLSGAAAHACTCGPGTVQSGDVCVPSSTAKGSKSSATSNQSQGQGQTQSNAARSNAAGGSVGTVSSQSVSAATGGSANVSDSSQSGASSNAQSTTYSAPRAPVSTAIAGFQQTTAGCRFAEGLGIQLSQAGTSVGFTFKDHDCVRIQLAEFFYSRGQDIAGDRIICAVHEVRATLGDDCLALVHQIVATVPADAVTHKELATFGRAVRQSEGLNK